MSYSNEIKSLVGAGAGVLTPSTGADSHASTIDAAVLQQLGELVELLSSEASVTASKNDLVTDPTKQGSGVTAELFAALAPAVAELKGLLKNQLPQGLGSSESQAATPGTDSKEEHGPNLSDVMGLAVLYLQQFEQSVAKAQADQDKMTIAIGKAMVASALENQKNIADQLAEIAKKQEEAKHRPWWSTLLQVLAAIVAPIVSVLTMGAGAAAAVVLIAAFMASPLYGKVVQAVASRIADDLKGTYYNEDIKKGMSPEDAKTDSEQRAQAVGNVIASVVVIVAIAIVSFGVGGVETAAKGAANVAEEAAGEAGAVGETELQWSGKQGARIAGMEAVQTIASTNLPMQIMMTDPNWVKKNHDLALVLDAIAEIALALVSMAASGKCMTGNKGSQYLMNNMLGLASKLNKVNTVVQTASSSYGVYAGVEQVKLLNDQAALTKVLAGLQKQAVQIQASQQMNMETESRINETATSMTKSIDEMKDQIMKLAGKDFDAVNSVIGR